MYYLNNIIKAAIIAVLGLMLASCELLGPKRAQKIPLSPVLKDRPGSSLEDSVVFKELENKQASTALNSKVEIYPSKEGGFPQSKLGGKGAIPSGGKSAKSAGPGTYSLNFDDAELSEVAKVILSDILGQNYVLSPKVVGKVTLNTTEPLTKEELLPTLEMVLRMNNAALVKDGKIYHIEPVSEALYGSSVRGSNKGYQSRVIAIRNVAAKEIADILKPLVHDKTVLNVDESHNTIMVQGTTDEISRVLEIVSTFDIDVLRGRSFALFPLKNTEPDKIIEELEEIFDVSTGKDANEFFKFMPIERMNAILAITHQSAYLHDIESWIYRLDRANTENAGGVTVYRVQHMDAEELADTLNEIFTGGGGSSRDKSSKVAAGRKSGEASNKSADSSSTDSSNATGTGASTSSKKKTKKEKSSKSRSGGGGNKDNDISIVADIANNSLIITATPQEYSKIMPVIKQLDIMPLQVLIEATIAQVDLKDDLQYGIQWYLGALDGKFGSGNSPGRLVGQVSTDSNGVETVGNALKTAAIAGATGGFSALYNASEIKALLSAQAGLGNVRVVSSPSLMVLNNQEAKINVGDQVPIQTSNLTNAIASTGSSNTSNSGFAQANQIQYKDTGVILEVTPRVNSSGMVILELSQEVSKPVETVTGVTTSPTIQKEKIESTVAVKDGETFALGGLIQNTDTFNKGGIPFLHELPVIGSLFGTTTKNDDRKELVVLLTPKVVKSKQDAREVTDELKRKLSDIYYDPFGRKKKGDWWRARTW
jgi:general secretion pathway protein D